MKELNLDETFDSVVSDTKQEIKVSNWNVDMSLYPPSIQANDGIRRFLMHVGDVGREVRLKIFDMN
jgi:hypothetical protein